MKKIFLDVDEEIVSVIDRLKAVEEGEVSLVVPKESGLLQSVVNLKLLKREAGKLKKTLSIVTSNKVGRTLAENVGLSVVGGKEVAPKKDLEGEEVELKTADSEEEGVLIEYREEPKAAANEEETPVTFKKGALKDKNSEDDEISIKEEAPVDPENKATPEESEKEVKDLPKFAKKSGGKRFKLNGFMVAVFLAFIGLFIFGYIYIPRATITVKILAQSKAFETDITVDKNEPDSKLDRGLLAGDFIELTKDYQKKFQATGKKEVGTKASGTITVSNKFDSNNQVLVQGTRFSTGSLIFKTKEQVTVPGATVAGGSLIAGTINVSVEAENPGAQYNIQGSHFSIPAFSGTPKDGLIYGDSAQAMSGGESKEVTIVTQSDFNQAKESYSKDAKEDARKALKDKLKKDYSLPEESTEIAIESVTSNPKVGDEATDFTITVKINAKGIAFKENDFKAAYKAKVQDEAGTSREVVEDGFDKKKTTYKADLKGGTIAIAVSSKVYLGDSLDKKRVFAEISGQTEKKSLEYLTKLENVEEANIKFSPSFLKRIPRLEKHVIIKTEAIQEDSKDSNKEIIP